MNTIDIKLDSAIPTQVEFPSWAKSANIYEVNLRQYTQEGTFNGFRKHLPRIAEMGVDIVWLMPIYPISNINRKATGDKFASDIEDPIERAKYLGSPYAVGDYQGINPDLGTAEDLKTLITEAHALGMKVILDYVPNHTGWDNPWITDHPEWYTHDSHGNITEPLNDKGESMGWADVAHLNYDNQEMRIAQIENFIYWIEEFDIDGFRHDIAFGVPQDFWNQATNVLREIKPDVFLLAEAQTPDFRNLNTFNVDYGWDIHHLMNDIAKGNANAEAIWHWYGETKHKNHRGLPMLFITNHDENSWAGTIDERMGESYKAFAVFTATFDGMMLIYGGQEEPLKHRLKFFEKDTIGFENYSDAPFYTTLTSLKHENEALWNESYGGSIERLPSHSNILAYQREKNGNQVVVIINMSAHGSSFELPSDLVGFEDAFRKESVTIHKGITIDLQPWEYKVFTKR